MKIKVENKIFIKVFTIVFIAMAMVFSLFSIYTFIGKKDTLLKSLKVEALNISKSIALACADALVLNEETFLLEFTFEYLKQNKEIKNLIIVKKDNRYLSIEKNKWDYKSILDKLFISKQEKEIKYEIVNSPILNKEIYLFTYPINLSGLQCRWIHVSLNIDEYLIDIKNLYYEYCFLLLAILSVAFASSYIIASLVTQPILLLNKASKKVISGDLSQRVKIRCNDEIGEFSYTFNKMLKNLENSKKELVTINQELENRVITRTSELKYANTQLYELNESFDIRIKSEINKQKEQEQILIHQSRLAAMGEMISMIAHQWRQPLNGLGLLVQNIQLQYEFNSLTKEFIEDSINQSNQLIQKMSSTINDFRDFFKPNKKKKEFILYDLFCSTYLLLKSSFSCNAIDVDIEESDLKVYVCENELSQVLLNILSNSKDAFVENNISNRKIKIRLKQSNKNVIIEIDDNAGGIPKKIIHKIFEPYFSTKEEKNGTGIGLYMAKVIIERNMKGKLFPEILKDGTRFTIVLNK